MLVLLLAEHASLFLLDEISTAAAPQPPAASSAPLKRL